MINLVVQGVSSQLQEETKQVAAWGEVCVLVSLGSECPSWTGRGHSYPLCRERPEALGHIVKYHSWDSSSRPIPGLIPVSACMLVSYFVFLFLAAQCFLWGLSSPTRD